VQIKIIHTFLLLLFIPFLAYSQIYVEKLDDKINSADFDELGPVINGNKIFFTKVASPDFVNENSVTGKLASSLQNIFSQIAGKKVDDIAQSDFNQDIWVAELSSEGRTEKITHPNTPLNNVYPNSACSYFPEEDALIVLNQFYDDGSISEGFSKVLIKDGNYQKPIPLEIYQYEDFGTDVNMSISSDGQHLFISMKGEFSKGKNDLYVSIKIGENLWSKPQPISGSVNTPFNESSPYITPDKKTLIFSSDRPGGKGKQDLYISQRLDYSYKKWSDPVALEYPINTEHDEYLAILTNDKKYLYFSSNRDGSSDIFRVDMERPELLPEELTLYLKIINAKTGEVTRGEIQWKSQYDDEYEGFFRTYTGEFELVLKRNEPFVFQVDKRGFASEKVEISPWDLVVNNITRKEIEIYIHPGEKVKEKKEYGFPFGNKRTFTLDEIFFAKGSDAVLPRSTKEMDKLAKVLSENPSLEILIEGHTDNVGDQKALVELSLKRAKAIKSYLVLSGIDESRIGVFGYGAQKALNGNENEKEREKNRRVEIRITKE
jgi:outer membrane protein OmpA-like peptidoglycan-associated protein